MSDLVEVAAPGGPGTDRRPGSVVARILVAVLAAGVPVWAAVNAAPAGRAGIDVALCPDTTDSPHVMTEQFACIGVRLAERLPPGSVVAVGDLRASGSEALWQQRLTEMAFPVATITDDPARATHVITVARTMSPESCSGFDLIITPGGG